jgi:hypothetical protein
MSNNWPLSPQRQTDEKDDSLTHLSLCWALGEQQNLGAIPELHHEAAQEIMRRKDKALS